MIKKVKNIVPWTYVTRERKGEGIVRTVYEKELEKTNQTEFRTEKVIKIKLGKLYIKWNRYDNFFNSWIDKKYI